MYVNVSASPQSPRPELQDITKGKLHSLFLYVHTVHEYIHIYIYIYTYVRVSAIRYLCAPLLRSPQSGPICVAVAACNFLGDFSFDSDAGARAALQASPSTLERVQNI